MIQQRAAVKSLKTAPISIRLMVLALAAGCWLGAVYCPAQNANVPAIEGYITAVDAGLGFDVNGTAITTSDSTSYQRVSSKGIKDEVRRNDVLRIGGYVEVIGTSADAGIAANSVILFEDQDRKIEGFGVIEKVMEDGPDLLLQADGYRIRIAPATVTKFSGGLNSIADIGADTWLKYEGKRDPAGILIASDAAFVPGRKGKVKPSQQPAAPTQDSLIDADGNFLSLRTKVRYADSGGPCGWHRYPADGALQTRVQRVGMLVAPAYQKQLAADQPSKIRFRFYAVDEAKIRADLSCNPGLILVPKQVVERLANDDQLAAVLADGVAAALQNQSARLILEYRGLVGAEIAGEIAAAFVPGINLAADVGTGMVAHRIAVHADEQRGRIALALMADAGYDPWQAPEAWRLLAPKHLPKDPVTTKYPSRSGYQLGILSLQYRTKKAAAREQVVSEATNR
jgi:hypothetical protein